MSAVIPIYDVEYEHPLPGNACDTKHAWARVPVEPSAAERAALKARIRRLLKERNAVMVSHYYVHPDLQDLAEETGGIVSDSLEMARFGRDHAAQTLVVSGVKFMGETAKIVSPEKRVLMPDLDATCSLDLGCPIDEFSAFCDQHPGPHGGGLRQHQRGGEGALRLAGHFQLRAGHRRGRSRTRATRSCGRPTSTWARYIQRETGADMVFWNGSCIVHDEFKAFELEALKKEYPKAKVLVHPESPADVVALADAVGSTSAILKAAREMDAKEFIVATDNGMMHKLRTLNPDKVFIEAPTAGNSATCKSCAHCPWMAMNGLAGLAHVLETGTNEVHVDPGARAARARADRPHAGVHRRAQGGPAGGLAGAEHRRGLS